MTETLYRVQEPGMEEQKKFIKEFSLLREKYFLNVEKDKNYEKGGKNFISK
jgi:hypothetical protein